MWFSRKQAAKEQAAKAPPADAADSTPASPEQITTKSRGDAAEAAARAFLAGKGFKFLTANYRTPGRGGGEIDLVMRAPDGTLVFVEVRQRTGGSHGGAAASISRVKQQRIILAARHYLMQLASPPPCRFDVVLVQGSQTGEAIEWLPGAFDAS